MSFVTITNNRAILGLLTLLSCSLMHGMAIKDKHFILPDKLDGAKVYYDNDGFRVLKNKRTYNIPSYGIPKDLRHRSKAELKAYLKTGFLELKRMSDESYKIEGHQRGVGSGPVLAVLGYFVVQGVGIGAATLVAMATPVFPPAAAASAAIVLGTQYAAGAAAVALSATPTP